MLEIEGRYVEIDGARTYYESCGTGAPVLLIHTAGRDGRQWQGLMQELGSTYRFFCPDLPGHGKSWPLAGNACLQDIQAIAEWLHRFALRVMQAPLVVMGCSIGGNLSLLMGARFKEVRAVVALQGCDWTPTFTDTALDLMTHPQISLMHSNMDFSMSLVGSKSTPAGREFSAWGVLSLIPLAQQGDLRAYAHCDTRELMGKITAPTVLLRGTEDWLVSENMMRATFDRIVNAHPKHFEMLPGLGHFPHLEDPTRVAATVRRFLKDAGV
ncbi:MAG: alpha/beta fold hydrolase [Pseudorhodoplanes sp.]